MARLLKILLVVLASLAALTIVLAVAAVVFIDSPPVKRFVSDRISQRIGRTLTVAGPLKIGLGLQPRIELNDIRLANASWADSPRMATVRRLVFRIDVPALIGGQIVFSEVDIDRPVVHLQRSAKGQSNWAFMTAGKDSGKSQPTIPVVQSLKVADGRLTYAAPRPRIAPLTVTLDTLTGQLDKPARRLQLDGAGRINDEPFTLALNSTLQKHNKDQPIPLDAKLTLARASAQIHGTLAQPMSLRGLDADLHADVPQPSDLAALAGIKSRSWPALRLDGRLIHRDRIWRAADIVAQVGENRITGHAAYNTQKKRPLVSVDLKSPRINLASLLAQQNDHSKPERPGSLTPDIGFHTPRLNAIDATVHVDIARLITGSRRLDQVGVDATLRDGRLLVKPLQADVGGGEIAAYMDMHGSETPVQTAVHINVNRLDLRDVLDALGITKEGSGVINGQVELAGTGDRLPQFMASADGDVTMIMQHGRLDRMLMRLIGQSARGIFSAMFGSNQGSVKLRCMISDWHVADGEASIKHLVVDTPDLKIIGKGAINLDNGGIDLTLMPHSKGLSLFSSQTAVDIQGRLGKPVISIDRSAVFSSFATPVEMGLSNDTNCRRLARTVRR